ncbi:hypothetical protein GGI07_002225 [Coemansia sp. Benny D115]|nr:hypothetical protein GGI07_002225 [Coemansia sp. Benny D115]
MRSRATDQSADQSMISQPPPSTAITPTATTQPTNALDDLYLNSRTALDANMLSELLDSLQNPHQIDSNTEYSQITNPAVLLGLHSLDDFERQAAIHHDHSSALASVNSHMNHSQGSVGGFGSFDEAELSAALEQIDWANFIPSATATVGTQDPDMQVAQADATLAAPTPAPTPVPGILGSVSGQQHGYSVMARQDLMSLDPAMTTADLQSDEEDEDDDFDEYGAGGSMELEELSMFSLFLTNMKAFEYFLTNLSLNQLRQCAATVNSVLVKRESAMDVGGGARGNRMQGTKRNRVQGSERTSQPATVASTAASTPVPSTAASVTMEDTFAQTTPVDDTLQTQQRQQHQHRHRHQLYFRQLRAHGQLAYKLGPLHPLHLAQPLPLMLLLDSASDSPSNNGPQLETDATGTPWLTFTYAQKGKPRRHRIRIDIDRAPISAIPQTFQTNNCVYPRANCPKAQYAGNRWNYETECNSLGWKLGFLNQGLLTERRGLLQTAVNNYRTMVSGRKSRRVTRMEKAEQSGNKREAEDTIADGDEDTNDVAESSKGSKGANKRMRHDSSKDNGLVPPPVTRAPSASASASASASVVTTADVDGTRSGSEAMLVEESPDTGCNNGAVEQPELPPQPATATATLPSQQPETAASSSSSKLTRTFSAPNMSLAASTASQTAKCLTINAFVNGKFARIRVSIDFGTIDLEQVDQAFRQQHAVFPRALVAPRSKYDLLSPGRWEFEVTCNELAWKLAWLNKGRLRGRKPLIQKCLDAYRARFRVPPWTLLRCFEDDMQGKVDQRFFAYWVPRPGRKFVEDKDDSGKSKQQKSKKKNVSGDDESVAPGSEKDDDEAVSCLVADTITVDVSETLPTPVSAAVPVPPKAVANVPASTPHLAKEAPNVTTKSKSNVSANVATASSPSSLPTCTTLQQRQQKQQQQQEVSAVPVPAPMTRLPSGGGKNQELPVKNTNGTAVRRAVVPPALRTAAPRPPPTAPTTGSSSSSSNTLGGGAIGKTLPSSRPSPNAPTAAAASTLKITKSGGSSTGVSVRSAASQEPSGSLAGRPNASTSLAFASIALSPSAVSVPVTSAASSVAVKQKTVVASSVAATTRPPAIHGAAKQQQQPQGQGQSGIQKTVKKQQQVSYLHQHQQQQQIPLNQRKSESNGLAKPTTKSAATSSPPLSSAAVSLSSTANKEKSKSNGNTGDGSVATSPSVSARSAKAQAAANMLTDVLRQLVKSDPKLVSLAGVLEKNGASTDSNSGSGTNGSANSGLLARTTATQASDNGLGDTRPLDAKLAEVEKLILDLHKR